MKTRIQFGLSPPIAALVFVLSSLAFATGLSTVSSDQALKRLMQGNARFVSGHLAHAGPEEIAEARSAVAKSQNPFAVIVGCSDSRVGPETVFDQGCRQSFCRAHRWRPCVGPRK